MPIHSGITEKEFEEKCGVNCIKCFGFMLAIESRTKEFMVDVACGLRVYGITALFLPKKDQSIETVLKEMKRKHEQRARFTDSVTNKVYERLNPFNVEKLKPY